MKYLVRKIAVATAVREPTRNVGEQIQDKNSSRDDSEGVMMIRIRQQERGDDDKCSDRQEHVEQTVQHGFFNADVHLE